MRNVRNRRPSPPATKRDVDVSKTALQSEIHTMGIDLRGEMKQMGTDLRGEMKQMGTDLRGEMKLMFKRQKKELIDEMKLLIENLHHDLMGAKKDQVALHEDHLQRHDGEILSIRTFVRMPA